MCLQRCGDRKIPYENDIQTCTECRVKPARIKKESRLQNEINSKQKNRKNNPKCQFPDCNYKLKPDTHWRTCFNHKNHPLPESTLCDSCENIIYSVHKSRTCIECQPKIEKICEGCETIIKINQNELWKVKCFDCHKSGILKKEKRDHECLKQLNLLSDSEFDLE